MFQYAWRRQYTTLVGGCIAAGVYTVDAASEKRFRDQKLKAMKPSKDTNSLEKLNRRSSESLPSRNSLKESLKQYQFDILVIGGGATGAGVALDAQSRGLSTALVECDDFSSGTSSRSTKLLQGGIRYLAAAFSKFDIEQFNLIKNILFERTNLMESAPHLTIPIPLVIPIYKWWQIPFLSFLIKLNDFVAGRSMLKPSKFISRKKVLELCPLINDANLKAGILYFDGQQNDSRVNLSVMLTAIRIGAKCLNYTKIIALDKNADGKIIGATAMDQITGEVYKIRSKCVVNAAGSLVDEIRGMADRNVHNIGAIFSSVHIALPAFYCPTRVGLVQIESSDGRLIFVIPWEGKTIVGTSHVSPSEGSSSTPTDADINYLLDELRRIMGIDIAIKRDDVKSAWCGRQPLAYDVNRGELRRKHVVEVMPKTGLVTITGGKWTTFLQMAQETVDKCILSHKLSAPVKRPTRGILIEGAHYWYPMLYSILSQEYNIEEAAAKHLCSTYGDRAIDVIRHCTSTTQNLPALGVKLHPDYPYLEAEVRYAVQEYAQTAVDVIARRTRIAFLDAYAARSVLPRIIEIMAEELEWTKNEQKRQLEMALDYLDSEMKDGRNWEKFNDDRRFELTDKEQAKTKEVFEKIDKSKKGYFTSYDFFQYLQEKDQQISEKFAREIFNEADQFRRHRITLNDLYHVVGGIKVGINRGRRMFEFMKEAEGFENE